VEHNRGELVRALLVLARAWWAAGRPAAPDLVKLGSFESWAETVGGILACAGVSGFLANSERVYQRAAQADAEWESFYSAWHEAMGEEAITVAHLADAVEDDDEFRETVPPYLLEALEKNRASFVRKLGNALSRNEGKRYGEEDFYVSRAGTRQKVITWQLRSGRSEANQGGLGGGLGGFVGFHNPVTRENSGPVPDDSRMGRGAANPPDPPNPSKFRVGEQTAEDSASAESVAERDETDSSDSLTRRPDAADNAEGGPPDAETTAFMNRCAELAEEARRQREEGR
ncbi:MAG: hypothetical protein M3P49_14155, partial [Actinomycetota bacterium]|nr:hypothetical protein [Actinomycetota bacterium]